MCVCVCVCDKPLCHCLRPAVICFSFEFHVLIPGVVVYPVTKYTSSIAACGWGVYLSLKLQQNCDMQQKCKGCGTEVWFSNRGSRASSQTLKKKSNLCTSLASHPKHHPFVVWFGDATEPNIDWMSCRQLCVTVVTCDGTGFQMNLINTAVQLNKYSF